MYLGVVDWVGPVVSIIEHEYVDERPAVLSYGERRSFSHFALGVPASCTNEPKGERHVDKKHTEASAYYSRPRLLHQPFPCLA